MPQVILSPKAARDFDRLRKFLHTKSPEAAARAVSTLRAALRRLAQHPLAQTPHPGNPAFRTLQVPFGSSGYTVWYHYLPGGDITIVALKHQREGGFDNGE